MSVKKLEALIKKSSLIDASHKIKLIKKLSKLNDHSIDSLIAVLEKSDTQVNAVNTAVDDAALTLIREYEAIIADFEHQTVKQLQKSDEADSHHEDEAILQDILKEIDTL